MLIGHMVRTHIQPVQTVHALYAEVLLAIYFTICHPIPLSTWSETEAASPNIKIFISLTTVLSLLTRVFCPIRGGVKVRCFWKSSLRETSWDAMTSGGQLHQRQFHQKLQQCHNFPTLISNPSFGTCVGCASLIRIIYVYKQFFCWHGELNMRMRMCPPSLSAFLSNYHRLVHNPRQNLSHHLTDEQIWAKCEKGGRVLHPLRPFVLTRLICTLSSSSWSLLSTIYNLQLTKRDKPENVRILQPFWHFFHP